ncbi:reverse transcriptase domain-containing protein [Dyadobacter sp. CY347]|uniref:reverse transcriptase domain-containing protein n=1 Tax=Dyadobacter sp. CY347 TaxID=2909336 RepID=UPI001EFEF53A|nr:reverse transcriptase domain-containing protein [Dyadobacter sp. CY347]MCF2488081.1 hypothetical protein [Dyadobacter sp. CY347]
MQSLFMIDLYKDRPSWLRSRGYIHITPKLNVGKNIYKIYSQVTSPLYVEKHAFFPLVHSVIKERKFKKSPIFPKIRGHAHLIKGEVKRSAKLRPLHYSTHIDSLIFGYYASVLQELYENELTKFPGLSECITAYRKIPIDPSDLLSKGKSTIHFANEAFKEITERANNGCSVLMFDIKSFFNEIDHDELKKSWRNLLDVPRLNAAHYNVFKASTDIRYILKDELRESWTRGKKKTGFDEKKLASIRKNTGREAFYESTSALKDAIRRKEIRVYKNPFRKDGKTVGIPQGLPISAVLANLYLLNFDKSILQNIVTKLNGFYRRYSDDIMIICQPEHKKEVTDFVTNSIMASLVEISTAKTEEYLFRKITISPTKERISCIHISEDKCTIDKPLAYLGFEFYGYMTLVKSANLAKFYRRMIFSVKRKCRRAKKIQISSDSEKPVIFRRRLRRKYSQLNLRKADETIRGTRLRKDIDSSFSFVKYEQDKEHNTNYFSYINKASLILDEPAIKDQLKKHNTIFNQAQSRHLRDKDKSML